jgi:hypothetical protein
VATVVATQGGTVLTFWHTGTEKMQVNAGDLSWEAQPVLVDVGEQKVYEPVTFVDEQGDTRCLCTDAAYIGGVPQPRTIFFPQLPTRSPPSRSVRQASTSRSRCPSRGDRPGHRECCRSHPGRNHT